MVEYNQIIALVCMFGGSGLSGWLLGRNDVPMNMINILLYVLSTLCLIIGGFIFGKLS
jgi:uncharacterized membrane protein YedE/YeeE